LVHPHEQVKTWKLLIPLFRCSIGSFDFYILSGEGAKDVISQYHTQIIGTPFLQPYWTLGFGQNRWGYQNWTNLQEVIDLYAEQKIQLEMIINDLDYLEANRIFTNSPSHYPRQQGLEFLDKLHAAGQYWFPILDPNVYAPDPTNASDAYEPYNRGSELDAYIRNGKDTYFGVLWAGISAYVDFLVGSGQQFWTEQFVRFRRVLPYDGLWLDVSDATSFCTYCFRPDQLTINPIHVP
jgi:alpha-glucosidase